MLATSYLSRRWPAKYFRLCKSLRPCSGWERVESLRFVTSKLSFAVYRLFSAFSLYAESCIRYLSSINFLLTFLLLWNQRKWVLTNSCFRRRFLRRNRSARPACICLRKRNTDSHRLTLRKSPRPISNARLKMLPLLHLHPINVVIYNGTY